MGQIRLGGPDAAAALETLVPVDVVDLGAGRQRYAFFTNTGGGLIDDLMVTRTQPDAAADFGDLFLVVNAAGKAADLTHLNIHVGHRCHVAAMPDRALLALQGPKAVQALSRLSPGVAALVFMTGGVFDLASQRCHVTRSGYTGEDGFEILIGPEGAPALAQLLLAHAHVRPIGLGARDSLRLEAGLHLYGHDMDPARSPVEAGLTWTIQKARRAKADFPGAARILKELADGTAQIRVGLKLLDKAPAREGAAIAGPDGAIIGVVTSGGFGPTVGGPIAMGYVARDLSAIGTKLSVIVRDQPRSAEVVALPFVPHRYVRKGS
jgi:aminomethyltransferase